MSSHVDGADRGSLAFAARHEFEEVDRQVEQVKVLGDERSGVAPSEILFITIEERPTLLRETYELALEGYEDFATAQPVTITLDEWLDECQHLGQGPARGLTPQTRCASLFEGRTTARRGTWLQPRRARRRQPRQRLC